MFCSKLSCLPSQGTKQQNQLARNSLMLLCFLLSVGNSRTLHSHLNLLEDLQEPFMSLTDILRKVLSNMSLWALIWSKRAPLHLFSLPEGCVYLGISAGPPQPAGRHYCSLFCLCFSGRGAVAGRPLRVEGERSHQKLLLWPSDAAPRASEEVPGAGLPSQVIPAVLGPLGVVNDVLTPRKVLVMPGWRGIHSLPWCHGEGSHTLQSRVTQTPQWTNQRWAILRGF